MRLYGDLQCSSLAIFVLFCLSLVGRGDAQFQNAPATISSLFTSWTNNVKISANGKQVQLVLDSLSAAGMGSKNDYLFGNYGVWMKLVPGDSAGTVTTFYMTSSGANHDEFDFEFLGNSTGQPYLLHTNIFANGVGGREEQIRLWFDPTADFHFYQFQWNKDLVVFYVDNTPIRMFKNNEVDGQPFPNKQPMGLSASIWDGSEWATEGGRIKINWASAPFIATYQNFRLRGCIVSGNSTVQTCQNSLAASPGASYQNLSQHRLNQLKWVKRHYVKYNYCDDRQRYPVAPSECSINVL